MNSLKLVACRILHAVLISISILYGFGRSLSSFFFSHKCTCHQENKKKSIYSMVFLMDSAPRKQNYSNCHLIIYFYRFIKDIICFTFPYYYYFEKSRGIAKITVIIIITTLKAVIIKFTVVMSKTNDRLCSISE